MCEIEQTPQGGERGREKSPDSVPDIRSPVTVSADNLLFQEEMCLPRVTIDVLKY